jgi:hypothetical protein
MNQKTEKPEGGKYMTKTPILACAALFACTACGHSFTNHAGRAVNGVLTAITNDVAVIGGVSYPMYMFPEAEQARMRSMLMVPGELPLGLKLRRRELRERAMRNEAQLKAGMKSESSAKETRAQLEAAWRRALMASGVDAATRIWWQSRLME